MADDEQRVACVCGRNDDPHAPMLECDSCQMWSHIACTPYATWSQLRLRRLTFLCAACASAAGKPWANDGTGASAGALAMPDALAGSSRRNCRDTSTPSPTRSATDSAFGGRARSPMTPTSLGQPDAEQQRLPPAALDHDAEAAPQLGERTCKTSTASASSTQGKMPLSPAQVKAINRKRTEAATAARVANARARKEAAARESIMRDTALRGEDIDEATVAAMARQIVAEATAGVTAAAARRRAAAAAMASSAADDSYAGSVAGSSAAPALNDPATAPSPVPTPPPTLPRTATITRGGGGVRKQSKNPDASLIARDGFPHPAALRARANTLKQVAKRELALVQLLAGKLSNNSPLAAGAHKAAADVKAFLASVGAWEAKYAPLMSRAGRAAMAREIETSSPASSLATKADDDEDGVLAIDDARRQPSAAMSEDSAADLTVHSDSVMDIEPTSA